MPVKIRTKQILGVAGLFMLALAGLAARHVLKRGSNAPLVLIPAPVLYTDPNIDPFDHFTPQDRTTVVEVFYATNRQGTGLPSRRSYHNGWSDHLRLGRARVRFGDPNTTWEQLHAASVTAARDRPMPVRLADSQEFGVLTRRDDEGREAEPGSAGDAEFARAVNAALAGKTSKEIKIYIHGYKVDFAHGCQLGAQLHHFAAREGVTVSFNWACRQRDITYFGDQKRARRSIPDLAALILFLADHTEAERINLLAYSAGSPILSGALVALRQRHADLDSGQLFDRLKIDDVIFAASDIGFREFVQDLEAFYDIPRRLLVTVCYDDAALSLSRRIHGGSRLGSADLDDLLANEVEILGDRMDKIDAVDVTYSRHVLQGDLGFTGHGYWYRNPWVCTDVLIAVYLDLLPEQRGLLRVPGRSHSWYFGPDYPQRVVAACGELAGLLNRE
jgi:esterase/lipase superfamily enzyme